MTLFSCQQCNSSCKGTQFPMESGSPLLLPQQPPPGQEKGLLLDPTLEDPLDHIQFRPWVGGKWLPQGKTPQGKKTIEVLDLNGLCRKRGPDILDLYKDHANGVLVEIKQINFLREGKQRQAERKLEETIKRRLNKAAPFAALSYDVLQERLLPELRPLVPRPPVPL